MNSVIVPVKNKLLLPRSGHKVVADNKYLYVIGGFVEGRREGFLPLNTNEVRGEIWRLHFVYKTWEKCSFDKEIFNLAASHSATKHGDCIFITGGTGLPFGVNILNHIIVIDMKKMTQKKYLFNPKNNLSKNLPIATYGHSVTYAEIDGRPFLFMIGGTTGTTYHQEVYKIDLITLESTLVSDSETSNSPRPRYKHEAFLYEDNIYMFGGTTQLDISFNLDHIHVFNIHTNMWTQRKSNCEINLGLRCPSMCQNGKYIYLTGGSTGPDTMSCAIYQFDISTMSWSTIGHWDKPCFFHDSVFSSHLGSIFTFGGVCRQNPPKRTNDLYQFQPLTGRVTPSLADLAWQSVLNMVINARNSSGDCTVKDAPLISQQLVRMGLPCSIVNRICIRDDGVTYAA